ncbi:hypothetical protein [Micromonospora sp. DH14]|uniref:hypothetical protein n=1 Tax=Micromonospora sp. DH14 TaxID=3040120 RepID=UPI0024411347|nr:hypothetical protein [Micromonospora sp. DH14]MDG9675812.1 hypothetical protein [Micromonospora sp. DH14]
MSHETAARTTGKAQDLGHVLSCAPPARDRHEALAIPQRHQRWPAVLAVSALMATLVAAVSVPAVNAQAAYDGTFCPKRQSVVLSGDGHTLHAWLQRDAANTLLHLCWNSGGGPADEIRDWAATAEDTAAPELRTDVEVLALTPHTAIGHVALTPGHTWRLSFALHTASGALPTLSMTVRI